MAITELTESDYDPVFKKHYFKLADNLYNSYDNIYSLLRKEFNFGGEQVNGGEHPVEVTFGGGVGSSADGTLPDANNTGFLRPKYTAKRNYARVKIDQMTIDSSGKSEHAFVRAIDQETLGKVKSFNRNVARQLFNDGTGALFQHSGNATSGTAAAPVLTPITTGNYRYRKAHIEKGDYVNINTDSSVFEITAHDRSAGTVTLSRISGSLDMTAIGAGTHTVYMQNSKDNDMAGLLGIHVNSSHYGVSEEFRWAPTEIDASSAALETDMLTELTEKMEEDTDETFTHLVFSPTQYRKYISLLEDQKRFPVPVDVKPTPNKMTSKELIARVSFGGIQYAGSQGNITVMKNKFVRDDMVFGINVNKMMVSHIKKFGWMQRDKTVFLRMQDKDAYEARYGGYAEIRINPFYVGVIYDLAT